LLVSLAWNHAGQRRWLVMTLMARRVARQPTRKQRDKTSQAAEGEQDNADLEGGRVGV